jgi:hypothetical protein
LKNEKKRTIFFREAGSAYNFRKTKRMAKSKKSKKEGLEKHRQMQREKKLKLKERRKVSLPQKHLKGKK